MRRTPPLIVGGGPAGAAAGLALARHGVRATLLERQRETGDAICGGFLSWRTLAALVNLGVAPGGHRVDQVRLFAGGRSASAPLPGPAMGLSRHRLDSVMLQAAEAAGAAVERGVTVREVADGQLRTSGGELAFGDLFLATGKHDLRGLPRPRPEGDPTLGLRVRLPAHPALARLLGRAIELHLFDRGYAGLVLQEDGSANLCLAVRKSRLAEAEHSPARLLAQLATGALGDRLAFLASLRAVDAIASVPYGWRAGTSSARVYRLGDQAAVIPSLAGEGMGIAIASGIAAANAWAAGRSGTRYQRDFARRTALPVGLATLLWRAAERPTVARVATAALDVMPSLLAALSGATRLPLVAAPLSR